MNMEGRVSQFFICFTPFQSFSIFVENEKNPFLTFKFHNP